VSAAREKSCAARGESKKSDDQSSAARDRLVANEWDSEERREELIASPLRSPAAFFDSIVARDGTKKESGRTTVVRDESVAAPLRSKMDEVLSSASRGRLEMCRGRVVASNGRFTAALFRPDERGGRLSFARDQSTLARERMNFAR
jgi:hypothetical protein